MTYPHKNISIGEEKEWRMSAIFILLLLTLAALFYSRALLSISMIGLLVVSFLHKDWKKQVVSFISNPFLVGVALLFFVPFISILWSENLDEWGNVIRVKLPLLFTPLVFAGSWQLSEKRWRYLGYAFIMLTLIATGWSFMQYITDMEAIHESYLRSKVIKTPLDNDHIRFSWMVSIAVLLCLLFQHLRINRYIRIAAILVAAWLAVYLHVLSARTGLLTLYVILFLYTLWLLFSQENKKIALVGLASLILLPMLAWLLLPTFQNRIRYMIYDISHVQTNTYLPGSNDGNRVLSLRAGWEILKENPLGVGMGDVKEKAYSWYDKNVPGIIESDKIEPSSEWLIYGDAAGWPGVIIFSIIMLIPLLKKNIRFRLFWFALNLTAALSFVFDIGLEGQYGVFLYAFLVFWWWKWLGSR